MNALIVVDMQNDFVTGSLAVPGADELLQPINELLHQDIGYIFFTMDWHLPDHMSFKAQGGPWPEHCIMYTDGAKIADGLYFQPDRMKQWKKAIEQESYSAFEGHQRMPALAKLLKFYDVDHLTVCGVATDYCVKHTVLDALHWGFEVTVIQHCIAAVAKDTGLQAIAEMRHAGARIL